MAMKARLFNKSFGLVRLRELSPGVFRLQYRAADGSYKREKLPPGSLDEAVEMALHENDALKGKRGFLPKLRESPEALAYNYHN